MRSSKREVGSISASGNKSRKAAHLRLRQAATPEPRRKRIVLMPGLRLIQGDAIALDPGMRFKFFTVFADSHSQVRADALPSQQPPERQRFFKASGTAKATAHRGTHHANRQIGATGRGAIRRMFGKGEKLLQKCLRLAKSTQAQTQRYQGQQCRCTHKKHARRALQRAKPPKAFPHFRTEFEAIRYPRAAPAIPQGANEAIPA